jgi:hypothetical protein
MEELGIQSIELTEDDQAIIADEGSASPAAAPAAPEEESYLDELEKLAALRDQGIITEEDYEAKKKQLLGL